jgi:hypothetical protein
LVFCPYCSSSLSSSFYSNDWNIYCVNQGTSTSFFCRVWIIIFQTSNPFSYIFLRSASHGWEWCSKGITWLLCSLFFLCLSVLCLSQIIYVFLGWSFFKFLCA